jgi:hypothetical protein
LIRAADDHRDLNDFVATYGGQVTEEAAVPADETDRSKRILRHGPQGRGHPLRESFAAPLHCQSISQVVGKNDIEARQELVLDVALDVDQATPNSEAIVDVAVENELARSATLEGDIKIRGPRWSALRGGHGAIMPVAVEWGNEPVARNR